MLCCDSSKCHIELLNKTHWLGFVCIQMAGSISVDYEQACSKLEEILKCPICLEYLEPPVWQCVRGHGVCSKCKKQLAECPMCRQPFNNFKATVLSQVVEVVPRACKYRQAGCSVISFVREMHNSYCAFRPTKCIICGTLVPHNSFFKHYESAHKKISALDNTSGTFKDFKFTENSSKFNLFPLFGHLFWRKITVDVDKHLFTIAYVCVPSGKPNCSYSAKIKFHKGTWKSSAVASVPVRVKEFNFDSLPSIIIIPLQTISQFAENSNDESFYSMHIEEHKEN